MSSGLFATATPTASAIPMAGAGAVLNAQWLVATNASGVLKNDGAGNLSWVSPASGTVTSVSIATANGFTGTVATATTTPTITLTTSITGLLQGNGTALSAVTVGTGLSFTGGTLACTVTAPTGANPSATIGITAANGSATTFMRSDGAPPISQAIVPTWTGLHTFATSVVLGGASTDRVNFVAGNSAAAPGTNLLLLTGSINVYGSAANLLGSPAAWLSVQANGTAYKLPLFTP